MITDHENAHKFPINDFFLIPHVAVHAPEMTRTLPAALTATAGMDALSGSGAYEQKGTGAFLLRCYGGC